MVENMVEMGDTRTILVGLGNNADNEIREKCYCERGDIGNKKKKASRELVVNVDDEGESIAHMNSLSSRCNWSRVAKKMRSLFFCCL